MKRTELKRKTPLRAKTPMTRSTGRQKRPPATKQARAARASQIRASARGHECQLRLPGVCNHNSETVVAAHIRISGTCGTGLKPSDLLTVRACDACHSVIDGRAKAPHITPEELILYIHEAHCRTLVEYEREGLIHAQ